MYTVGGAVYKIGQATPTEVASANGYRLPSEKEWEFAARGGTQTQGYTYSGSNNLSAVGWYNENSGSAVHEVGKKLANELGIYDMSGNLREWSGSWYPGSEGSNRVIRGGNWYGIGGDCGVANRGYLNSEYRSSYNGFRVATCGEYALGITAQPSVSLDGTELGVEAAGAGTLTHQWRRNGVGITGGTSSQLPTQGLQSGTYIVVVSNGFASVTSGSIQFNVPTTPTPTSGFAFVTGGTLPASSQLGALPVDTFYIGRTEVTWGEWQTVRTWAVANGYTDLANVGQGVGDSYPVTYVNCYDVVKWCNARSEKEGRTPVYLADGAVYKSGQVTPTEVASANGYRLPTEAEWEFAARGGTTTNGYTYSGSNDLNAVGWYSDNSGYFVHEVGKKLPNELGIFDMSGNVREWSGSWWYPGYEGSALVIRGGAWRRDAGSCAVAYRYYDSPGRRYDDCGFRVATPGEYALEIPAQPSVSADGTKLSVAASGAGTLTYQWRLNGEAIAGGTSSQLATQGLQSGTYTVVVGNGFASKTTGSIQYPSHIGTFALVTGGTLPASSRLGALPVEIFYIGKNEVTWGEWQTVRMWAVTNGYTDLANVGEGLGNNYPVTNVNWYDVVKWCNARSEMEGKTPVYKNGADIYRTGTVTDSQVVTSANGYRLPSEAEWEFAARGGTTTNGYTYSGSNDLSAVGWYRENSGYAVHEVGKKLANELGIYDMSGNLWEWSGSWYPGLEGSSRVLRGGFWSFNAEDCAVALRYYDSPGRRYDLRGVGSRYGYGFRVALSSVP